MAVKVKQHRGRWWVFIDHKGKRKAKCIGKSQRAAQEVAGKIEAKLKLGDFSLLEEKTQRPFDTYFRTWLDTYVKAHCKEQTHDVYAKAFRLYLLPAFGQTDITAITREAVKRLAYGLLARGKSRGTAKWVLTPLSGMLSTAVEDGHLTSNPALRVLKRSRAAEGQQHDRIQPFTREEVS